jgi:hypothetical protein
VLCESGLDGNDLLARRRVAGQAPERRGDLVKGAHGGDAGCDLVFGKQRQEGGEILAVPVGMSAREPLDAVQRGPFPAGPNVPEQRESEGPRRLDHPLDAAIAEPDQVSSRAEGAQGRSGSGADAIERRINSTASGERSRPFGDVFALEVDEDAAFRLDVGPPGFPSGSEGAHAKVSGQLQ